MDEEGVRTAREETLVRGLLSGVTVFRWLGWGWLAAILVVSRPELEDPRARPWVALTLAGLALLVTVGATALRSTDPTRLLSWPIVGVEVLVGFALLAGDQVAYNGVSHAQDLGSVWPLAGIITAGVAGGSRGGLLAGAAVGLGQVAGNLADADFDWDRRGWVSTVSTVVLFALAGGIAGLVTRRLREAERRIGLAQAREEVARTLHDGVLQTLALVQRRSRDDDIVRLAREQEGELREFLFGSSTTVDGGGDLGAGLRAAAARFEDRFAGTATVVVAPDLRPPKPPVIDAVVGAVTEALTNAGKHGGARSVTVYTESAAGELFCSVKDDGAGFDPATATEGVGLRRSVRGRISDVGGRVEVDGHPGRGTEVRCWVPV